MEAMEAMGGAAPARPPASQPLPSSIAPLLRRQGDRPVPY